MIMEHDPLQEKNWVEISRSSNLEGSRALVPIALGKNQYILFRDDEGYLGLIGRNCPHRGADLCYGRLEDNGIRCPFLAGTLTELGNVLSNQLSQCVPRCTLR